jgi:hypothetical protein
MSLRQNMKTMLADSHDSESVSSKRVITFIAFILCCVAFIANMFFGYKIDTFIYETMAYIVIGGISVTGIEKFANRNRDVEPQYKPKRSRWDDQDVDFHP